MKKTCCTPFTKYSGSGNDFVIIDNRDNEHAKLQDSTAVQRLCSRHEGIGADGIIFLESSIGHPFRMRIFQPDAKEVEMCGNGLRCLGHFIHTLDPHPKEFDVATMHSVIHVTVQGNDVTIEMPPPKDLVMNRKFTIEGETITIHTVNTGVPHAVLFVTDMNHQSAMELGRKLRYDPAFAPHGTNVNFVKSSGPTSLEIRTYERGVEGETQACGTGATAAAIIAGEHHGYTGDVLLKTLSKETLTVTLGKAITLKGPVRKTFSGVIEGQ